MILFVRRVETVEDLTKKLEKQKRMEIELTKNIEKLRKCCRGKGFFMLKAVNIKNEALQFEISDPVK